jgi:hypothetical protein
MLSAVTNKSCRYYCLRCLPAAGMASAMTPSGSINLSGSLSNLSAPNRSYHLNAFSSFASIAKATPPTSAETAKARSAAAKSKQLPRASRCQAPGPAPSDQWRYAKAKDRHIIAAKLLGQHRRHAGERYETGADRVEARHTRWLGRPHCDKGFGAPAFVVLSCVAIKIFVELGCAAVEVLAVNGAARSAVHADPTLLFPFGTALQPP